MVPANLFTPLTGKEFIKPYLISIGLHNKHNSKSSEVKGFKYMCIYIIYRLYISNSQDVLCIGEKWDIGNYSKVKSKKSIYLTVYP